MFATSKVHVHDQAPRSGLSFDYDVYRPRLYQYLYRESEQRKKILVSCFILDKEAIAEKPRWWRLIISFQSYGTAICFSGIKTLVARRSRGCAPTKPDWYYYRKTNYSLKPGMKCRAIGHNIFKISLKCDLHVLLIVHHSILVRFCLVSVHLEILNSKNISIIKKHISAQGQIHRVFKARSSLFVSSALSVERIPPLVVS